MDISIDPSKSLIRICRFCLNPMILVNYEFDLEDPAKTIAERRFGFFCDTCKRGTVLLEKINDDDYFEGQLDGVKHEPLTSEELKEVEDDTTPIATVTMEDGEIYVDFSEEFKEKNR